MASLVRPSPPCSLQLGSSRRCHDFLSVSLRIRLRSSRCRVFLAYCAQRTTGNGREGQSWVGSSNSSNSFGGWSGSEVDGDGKLPEKRGFGGMLGAGLAGVLFLGGITFATLSLSRKTSKTTSDMGVKQNMTALTTEQELQLISDAQATETVQVGNETSAISSDKGSKINDKVPNFLEVTEDPSLLALEVNEDKHGNANHLEASSTLSPYMNGEDNRTTDGYYEEGSVLIHTDVDNNTVSPDSNPFSPEPSANNAIHSTNDNLNTVELPSIMFSERPDSIVQHNENLCVNHEDSSLDTVSADYISELRNPSPKEIFDSDISLRILNEYKDGSPSETLKSNQINLEPSDMVDSHRSLIQTVVFVSNGDDLEHDDVSHLSEAESLGVVECAAINSVSSSILSDSDVGNEAPTFSNYPNNLGDDHKLHDSSLANNFSSENENNISIYNQSNAESTSESVLPEKSLYFTGVPAPSLVSSALQVPPGKVLVPAVVDQVQSQALAALQVLKVIESDVQPGDLCTRREYARWLVSASSAISRSPTSKMYPAMYVENVTELAFNDVTPEDPDFASIQGLAEAGIISSRFSLSDMKGSSSQNQDPFLFFPESPVSRQDLVSWKMALEKRKLPEIDRNNLYQLSGFLDIDNIDTAAWPALVADLSSGEHGIICLAFGYTRLFQPNKPVTKAQAAIALSIGEAAEIVGEELARIEAESLAETAVSEHAALVAQVEKEINASFAEELAMERKKIEAVEKLAEEARLELERIRVEREEENSALLKGRAVVESEMEVLSRLRCEVEEKLQELMSNKAELSFERERISRLRKETESENQSVVQLQYELEVERKALSLARTWAEEEAKRARELARSLEQARERWEKHGIKVIVDENLQEDALVGMTWISAGMQSSTDETIKRGESLAAKLKAMAAEIKLRSSSAINSIIQRILAIVSALKQHASESRKQVVELGQKVAQNAGKSVETIKESAAGISSTIGERAKRVRDDCKESVYRISQKFKA